MSNTNMEDPLTIIMFPEEDDWMMYVGHLRERLPDETSCKLVVGPAVPSKILAENIKLLFLFDKLRHLELSFSDDSYTYDHSCIAALAELLHITCLHITGGQPAPDVDPAALYSIKGLQELRLLPALDTGLTPAQVAGVAWLTGLTSLRFSGDREHTDDEVLRSLEPLQQLRELHVSPVAEEVGLEGLQALAALRSISTLTLGLHNAQVQHLQVLQPVPQLQLALQDPQEVDVPSLLSIGGWLLQHNLASLRLGVVPVANNDLFYSLATLTNLTTLNLSLIEAQGCTRAFLNIACLSSLVKLEELAVSCTSKVLIPLTAKAVSVLALSWRALRALSLSLAGTPCVVPEALQLLDSFACLQSLAITSPVDLLDAQATASLRSTRSQDLEVVLEEGRAASGALQRSSSIASSVWDLLSYSTSALVNVGSSALALTGITGPATPGGTPKVGSVPSSPRSMTSPLSRTSSRALPVSKLDLWLAQRQAEAEEYCPVYLDYLPSTLESLTLERAELLHHPPGPEGADGAPLEAPGTPAASADGQRPRKGIPQLRHLALDSCKLSDAGLAALLGHLTQLKSLELAELEGISDEGMAAVADVGSLQELVVFALECKGITAASLKAACTCPQLAVLAWATSDLVASLGDEELIPCLRRPAKLQRLMLYTQDEGVRDPEGALRRKFDWALPLVSVTYGPMEM